MSRMAFEDNKQFWKEFIDLYREHSCLWDVNSKDYTSRNARNRAYQALVLKCKEKYPTAEKYFVAKKINSLRTSFRRQFRKIQESTDEAVEPTLWYFDLLLFTLDQDEIRAGLSGTVTEDLGDDDINETDSQHEYAAPDSRHDPEQESVPVLKKRKRLNETVNWAESSKRDSSFLYGEFVADSIRNLKNKRLQSWVRNQINNVLYTAEQAYFQNSSQMPETDINFTIDTSLLSSLKDERKTTSGDPNKLKKNAAVNESASTSPLRGNTSSKTFDMLFKEEPSLSYPPSPAPN